MRVRQDGAWIETPESGETEAGIQALDQSFVSLSSERTRLLAHFTPSYPAVVSIEQQLRALRQQKYLALKSRYDSRVRTLEKRISALETKVLAKKEELARLAERTMELDRLTHRQAELEADVAKYTQKVEDLRIHEDLDAGNFTSIRIINEAVPPVSPSAPRKVLIGALAASLGLLFGVAFAIIAEFFNHTFRNEHDVRSVLGIPLLLTIPQLGK
ncbi:MAG: cell Wall and Capsule [Rhodospirillales bacterium]|nr:cell Wall and Capsule [Rhodospirillales bacterium]